MNIPRRVLGVLLLGWLIASLVVLGFRTWTVMRAGDVLSFTGLEGSPIYHVWKARNGLPVYEDTFAWPYPSALFNFLFYRLLHGASSRLSF